MKQINLITFAFIAILLLSSCKTESQKGVERTSISTELISDSIYTRMPGSLFKIDKYAVWQDPFGSADGFMHIIDTETKKEVGTMGRKGQGPKEFSTPSIGKGSDNTLYVFDLNSKKQALLSLDNLMSNKEYYISLPDAIDERVTYKMQLDDKSIVSLTPDKAQPFKIQKNDSIVEFGIFPIKEEINNGYNMFQGSIAFNENKKILVYSVIYFPYIAIYKRVGEFNFKLQNEHKEEVQYYISNNKLILSENNRSGVATMTLTKNYIVTIQRDYEVDNTDESTVDMDFEKLPTTLFLYNYKGELKKIVDVGMPILRIAGDIESNDLYAFGVDPEFVLVKCEL